MQDKVFWNVLNIAACQYSLVLNRYFNKEGFQGTKNVENFNILAHLWKYKFWVMSTGMP